MMLDVMCISWRAFPGWVLATTIAATISSWCGAWWIGAASWTLLSIVAIEWPVSTTRSWVWGAVHTHAVATVSLTTRNGSAKTSITSVTIIAIHVVWVLVTHASLFLFHIQFLAIRRILRVVQRLHSQNKTKRNVKIWSYWTKQAIIIGIWCSPCSLSNSERIQDLHRWWNHSSAVLVRQGFLVRVSNGFVDQPRCQIVQTWFSTLLPLQYEVHFLRTADGCHWIGLRCLIFVLNHTK